MPVGRLVFTHWEQVFEEAAVEIVPVQNQTFTCWEEPAIAPSLLAARRVPRNCAGESIGIYPLFDIFSSCSLPRLTVFKLLDEADLLALRLIRLSHSRFITTARANEPEAEPQEEFRNLRVAFALHFLQ